VTVELFAPSDRVRTDAALALRIAVFVDEQRIPLEEEIDRHDAADADAVHALARGADGRELGTGRYFREDAATARIGRMAVARAGRGRGVGAALLDALIAHARAAGFTHAVLNAQERALGFYAKAGFVPDARTNFESGIAHRQMRRAL
jgi:predicted GNAT family N-acyltransferase